MASKIDCEFRKFRNTADSGWFLTNLPDFLKTPLIPADKRNTEQASGVFRGSLTIRREVRIECVGQSSAA